MPSPPLTTVSRPFFCRSWYAIPKRGAKLLYVVFHNAVPRGASCIVERLLIPVNASGLFPLASLGAGFRSQRRPKSSVSRRESLHLSWKYAEKFSYIGLAAALA